MDYPTRTIQSTEICNCGNVFVTSDDYDTLGSESGVCCPSCGNEKFITVESLKQQRDDLLEALKQISDIEDARFTHAGFDLEVNTISKAAIAKCEA